jgi:hypothetical protein
MVRKVEDGHLPLSYGTDYRKILTNGENRLSRCVQNHGRKTVGIQLADEVLWFTQDDSAATSSVGTETPDFPQAVPATPLLHLSYKNRDENTQPGPNPGQDCEEDQETALVALVLQEVR